MSRGLRFEILILPLTIYFQKIHGWKGLQFCLDFIIHVYILLQVLHMSFEVHMHCCDVLNVVVL